MNSTASFEYGCSVNGGQPPETAMNWQDLSALEQTTLQDNDPGDQASFPVTCYGMNVIKSMCTACGAGPENQIIIPSQSQVFNYNSQQPCSYTACSSSYSMTSGSPTHSGGSFLDTDTAINNPSPEYSGVMAAGSSSFQGFGDCGHCVKPDMLLSSCCHHILLGTTVQQPQISKRWPCPKGCGKFFTRKGDAKRHAQNHVPTRRFRCPIEGCKFSKKGFGFVRRDKFLSHLRKAHGKTEDPNAITPDSALFQHYASNSSARPRL